jgi:RNA polymerase sigma factor (sigma-70 family)
VQAISPLTTTTALLDALSQPAGAPSDVVWTTFDRRYRPIIAAFAVKLGLAEQEATEVAQATMADFAREFQLGRYERGKGRLRSWIIRIAHNRTMDMHRERLRRRVERGESAIVQIPVSSPSPHAAAEALWEAERRRAILDEALVQLREGTGARTSDATLRAFELFALQQVPAEAVAEQCGMSVHEVYVAKTRVTGRLRAIVAALTEAYDREE